MSTPENTEDIARGEHGHILDSNDRPLELVAMRGVMAARDAHEKVESIKDAARAAQRLNPEVVVATVKEATTAEKAALWDGYQHYNQNRAAYQQAAIEEDERKRT